MDKRKTENERRIVCCVKWGEKYSADHVNLLYRMVRGNISYEFEFYCLTDEPAGLIREINPIQINEHELIGWWNKLLVFSDSVLPPCDRAVFFDLDVVVVGSIDFVFEQSADLTICAGFGAYPGFNSSVFSFRPDKCRDLFDGFWDDKDDIVERLRGDQDWIYLKRPNAETFDLGKVVSFKEETNCYAIPNLRSVQKFIAAPILYRLKAIPPMQRQRATYPKNTSVVVFHGKPDPWDVADSSFQGFRWAPYVRIAWGN